MPSRTRQRAIPERQALGRRIRAYRLALGLTARDVSAHIGTSRTATTAIENANTDVLFGTFVDVAAAVGLEVALVGEHHLPLLNLTADETRALVAAAQAMHTLDPLEPTYGRDPLRSALDKLTTTEETP